MNICELPFELLAGGVIGVAVTEFVRWIRQPRVRFVRLETQENVHGLTQGKQSLHRIRFRVTGAASGQMSSILLKWGPGIDQGTFAKWDETPEPSAWDSGERKLEPNLIPQTFHLPLFEGREYTVPILIKWETDQASGLDIFCGWWYARWGAEEHPLKVTPDDVISVHVQGMSWLPGRGTKPGKAKRVLVRDLLEADAQELDRARGS